MLANWWDEPGSAATTTCHDGRAASALLSRAELAGLAWAVALPGAWGRQKDTEQDEAVDGASRRRLMSQEMEITENLRRQTLHEGAGRKWWWRLLLNATFCSAWFPPLNSKWLSTANFSGLLSMYFCAAKVYSAIINIKQIWSLLSANTLSRDWSISASFHGWAEKKGSQEVCEANAAQQQFAHWKLLKCMTFWGKFLIL